MRTIKFRAQHITSNKWLFGDIRHHKNDVCIFEQGGNKGELVKPETIGQFTGLTDKNGKKIYEGDIVSHPWKDPIFGDLVETGEFVHSTICFNNGAFVVNYRLQGEYIYLQDFLRLKCLDVVGNIYDNPELIEKGGEQ